MKKGEKIVSKLAATLSDLGDKQIFDNENLHQDYFMFDILRIFLYNLHLSPYGGGRQIFFSIYFYKKCLFLIRSSSRNHYTNIAFENPNIYELYQTRQIQIFA